MTSACFNNQACSTSRHFSHRVSKQCDCSILIVRDTSQSNFCPTERVVSNMSHDWSLLPLAPLKLILQQLPLSERMQSCALVSSSWADAAVAATADLLSSELCLEIMSSSMMHSWWRAEECHAWCLKHHAYATNVAYKSCSTCTSVLDSPLDHRHLRSLCISADGTSQTVRLTASGKWRGLLQGTTALTSLTLENTGVYGWPEAAALLTSLKCLTICDVQSKPFRNRDNPHISEGPPGIHLSLLQQLTYLALQKPQAVTAAALQQLSHLSCLRELQLIDSKAWRVEDVMQLPGVSHSIARLQCLTSLTVNWCSSLPVGISRLTGLEELRVDRCSRVEPECFAKAINLRNLTITNSTVAREGVQGQLLQHLGRMKHLTSLNLGFTSLGDNWEEVPLSLVTNLTASSSSLQHLDLAQCSLPQGAWRHLFHQDSQQLTALTYLTLQNAGLDLAASDVKRLVQVCPNLRYLNLRGVLKDKVSLLPLTRLSALTGLDINRVTTESAVQVLAQLSGLQELRVAQPSTVSRVSRLHLTALKQLRLLLLPAPTLAESVCNRMEEVFSSTGPEVPHAWVKLLLDCPYHMRLPAAQQAEARKAAHQFKLCGCYT